MKSDQLKLKREKRIKLFTVLALISLGLMIILLVDNMLLSFILAFVINYLLNPLVNSIERAGLSRNLAVLIPFTIIGVILGLGTYFLIPIVSEQMLNLKAEMPKYIDGITQLIQDTENRLNTLLSFVYKADLSTTVQTKLLSWTTSLVKDLPQWISKIITISLLAPLFAFFMLRDGRNLTKLLLELMPNDLFELGLNLQHKINEQMGGFIRARLLESAIVGGVIWIGLALISFPYALFHGVFNALTNLIPYIGPFIGAIPAIIIALIDGNSSFSLSFVIIVFLVSQIIDLVFVIPLVVAKIVNLHPVTVILAIIIGSEIMGVLGMVISIPITSVFKLTTTTIYNHLVGFRSKTLP